MTYINESGMLLGFLEVRDFFQRAVFLYVKKFSTNKGGGLWWGEGVSCLTGRQIYMPNILIYMIVEPGIASRELSG